MAALARESLLKASSIACLPLTRPPTIADHVIHDCPFVVPGDVGKPDAKRLPGMDRLNALVWIARDEIDTIDANVRRHFEQIRGGSAEGDDQ